MEAMTPTPRRLLFLLAGCLVTLRVASGVGTGQQNLAAPPVTPETRAAAVSGFAPVGDVQLYYEVHGAGEPILFVHGGGGSIAGSWPSDYVTELSRDFRVILADSRGHGRTADGTGPITYGRLTFDAVRLLDHLGIDRAHVVGHSMGAITGLHLLVDFPDRVRTVTLLAGAYHVDNYRPEAYVDMKRELDAVIRGEKLKSRWASRPVSVLTKLRDSLLNGPTFRLQVLDTIDRPTLIVAAGQDTFFAPSVAEEMHAHIKGSELIVFPEATHRIQVTNVKELVPAIRDFITRRGGR
ncbi:MAG: alpha/beta hydrolase [Acidobacteria bacterium]|nr:alpha/beta hydrolase [Acidobacteriota bacterium]